MAIPTATNRENPVSLPSKEALKLDEFSELLKLALSNGDLLTGRLFCAQLFDLDTRPSLRPASLFCRRAEILVKRSQFHRI